MGLDHDRYLRLKVSTYGEHKSELANKTRSGSRKDLCHKLGLRHASNDLTAETGKDGQLFRSRK